MNGDISRVLFDEIKRYSSVRSQQGRTSVDADANEAVDIALNDVRSGRIDTFGRHGAPEAAPGMQIVAGGGGLQLTKGRYYVDGVACYLDAPGPIDFVDQPHLPGAQLPTDAGLYLFYLEAWERTVTAVQDPEIREVALGGPDTTTRTQVVWQVKALRVTTNDPDPTCDTAFAEWDTLVTGPTGTLELRLAEAVGATGPCIVPEEAGYTGVDNDAIRLAVHVGNFDPAEPGGAAPGVQSEFKWARSNGSVVAAWRAHPNTLEVAVDRIGPGGTNGFDVGQWVELTSDDDDLLGRPGVLAAIDSKTRETLTLVDPPDSSVSTALTPAPQSDPDRHTQARRWDSLGARSTAVAPGDPDVTVDGWIRIADGLEARFSGGTLRSGDFWVAPLRSAVLPGTTDRQLDWPVDGAGNPVAVTAHGVPRHYARLALADFDGTSWSNIRDCRRVVPPLAELLQVDHRGGDGQHARSGHWLAAPIRVGVTRGNNPVVGARVRFTAVAPGGVLSTVEPDPAGNVAGPSATLTATTGPDGIATVWWRLGDGVDPEAPGDLYQPAAAQRVEATLLDAADNPTQLGTHFVAHVLDNRTLTPAGGDGQFGNPGETLEIALRVRVADGGRPVAGARVLFEDLNRMLDNNALDEFTGGAIHASANVVSSTPWPGGSRMVEAVVATDADGEAQVQFILGTEIGLPVQRVMATLLDDAGQPTPQRHLFTAHLSIAGEITWNVCKHFAPLLNGQDDVQSALDLICSSLGNLHSFQGYVVQQLAALWNAVNSDGPQLTLPDLNNPLVLERLIRNPGGTLAFPPGAGRDAAVSALIRFGAPAVSAAEWIDASGARQPVGPEVTIPLGSLESLRIEPGFAMRRVPGRRRRIGMSVLAEEPLRGGRDQPVFGRRPIALEGTTAVGDDGSLTWTPSEGARAWLAERVGEVDGPLALEVEVDPGSLSGAAGDRWRSRFFVEG